MPNSGRTQEVEGDKYSCSGGVYCCTSRIGCWLLTSEPKRMPHTQVLWLGVATLLCRACCCPLHCCCAPPISSFLFWTAGLSSRQGILSSRQRSLAAGLQQLDSAAGLQQLDYQQHYHFCWRQDTASSPSRWKLLISHSPMTQFCEKIGNYIPLHLFAINSNIPSSEGSKPGTWAREATTYTAYSMHPRGNLRTRIGHLPAL